MKIERIRALRGPNLWSKNTSIEALVYCEEDERLYDRFATIEMRAGNYVLEDVSSYGTWVRFAGSESAIPLRRQEMVLHSDGEFSLGAPFTDFSAPMVSFKLVDGSVVLGPGGLRK